MVIFHSYACLPDGTYWGFVHDPPVIPSTDNSHSLGWILPAMSGKSLQGRYHSPNLLSHEKKTSRKFESNQIDWMNHWELASDILLLDHLWMNGLFPRLYHLVGINTQPKIVKKRDWRTSLGTSITDLNLAAIFKGMIPRMFTMIPRVRSRREVVMKFTRRMGVIPSKKSSTQICPRSLS